MLIYLNADPRLHPIRSDSRFVAWYDLWAFPTRSIAPNHHYLRTTCLPTVVKTERSMKRDHIRVVPGGSRANLYFEITSGLPVTRPESGPLIQSPKPKGETCVCWRHRNSRSRDQCYFPYGCRCPARRGDRPDELNTRERETKTRVFDIADGPA
jgi:hypothetical protein